MRPYSNIYEHPDFSVSQGSVATLRAVGTALAVVAASGAAVYEIVTHNGTAFVSNFLA